MDPLQAIAAPTHGVLVEITKDNSWETGTAGTPVYVAFVATNSTLSLSFVSLQTASAGVAVARLASRPAFKRDYQHGVVVEVHTAAPLEEGQAVYFYLAQSGATVYFPAQAIED
jgi:hypothetical protein